MAKKLTDKEWVGLAAADNKDSRVALTGIFRDKTATVATNGYRMHIATGDHGEAFGVHDFKTDAVIEDVRFPNWQQVVPVPADATSLPYLDIADAMPILKAAAAAWRATGRKASNSNTTVYSVTLPCADGSFVALNPEYVIDAASGLLTPGLPFLATKTLNPVLFLAFGLVRQAVVMPIRGTGKPNPRFDLTEFVKAHDGLAYPFPGTRAEL